VSTWVGARAIGSGPGRRGRAAVVGVRELSREGLEGVEFSVRQVTGMPGALVVDVAGEVDSSSAEQFRERLVSLIGGDTKHLIVNLADLTYINSSGLGALVAGCKRVRALDGTLKVCGVRRSIAEVMQLIRLDKIIEVHDTEEQALAAL